MSVHGANCSWADPLVIQVDAPLQHNIDHLLPAEGVAMDLNAAFLPSVHHLILADPVTRKHDAVVRWLVQIKYVLEAEFDVLVHAAQS